MVRPAPGSGRSLEAHGDVCPRGMAVLDRTRLIVDSFFPDSLFKTICYNKNPHYLPALPLIQPPAQSTFLQLIFFFYLSFFFI